MLSLNRPDIAYHQGRNPFLEAEDLLCEASWIQYPGYFSRFQDTSHWRTEYLEKLAWQDGKPIFEAVLTPRREDLRTGFSVSWDAPDKDGICLNGVYRHAGIYSHDGTYAYRHYFREEHGFEIPLPYRQVVRNYRRSRPWVLPGIIDIQTLIEIARRPGKVFTPKNPYPPDFGGLFDT